MARAAVQVQGVARLRRELKRAGVDLADLRDVNLRVARTVDTAARAPRRTGRLAASQRPGATKTAGIVRAGTAVLPYAPVVHYGSPKRNIRAQPWLVDAAHATEPAWAEMYLAELERIVSNLAGGP